MRSWMVVGLLGLGAVAGAQGLDVEKAKALREAGFSAREIKELLLEKPAVQEVEEAEEGDGVLRVLVRNVTDTERERGEWPSDVAVKLYVDREGVIAPIAYPPLESLLMKAGEERRFALIPPKGLSRFVIHVYRQGHQRYVTYENAIAQYRGESTEHQYVGVWGALNEYWIPEDFSGAKVAFDVAVEKGDRVDLTYEGALDPVVLEGWRSVKGSKKHPVEVRVAPATQRSAMAHRAFKSFPEPNSDSAFEAEGWRAKLCLERAFADGGIPREIHQDFIRLGLLYERRRKFDWAALLFQAAIMVCPECSRTRKTAEPHLTRLEAKHGVNVWK